MQAVKRSLQASNRELKKKIRRLEVELQDTKEQLDESERKRARSDKLLRFAMAQLAGALYAHIHTQHTRHRLHTRTYLAFRSEFPEWRPPDGILLQPDDHDSLRTIFKVTLTLNLNPNPNPNPTTTITITLTMTTTTP